MQTGQHCDERDLNHRPGEDYASTDRHCGRATQWLATALNVVMGVDATEYDSTHGYGPLYTPWNAHSNAVLAAAEDKVPFP